MRLVVDANILFSALIKEGTTRRLLLHPEVTAYSPEFIAREFLEHKAELASKSKMTNTQVDQSARLLLENVKLVPDQALAPYLPAAKSLTKDKDDWLYIATCLSVNADLWTMDKEFQTQKRVRVWTTNDLLKELG